MKTEAKELLIKYLTLENLNHMKFLYDHREDYFRRDGRGGLYFHRGFYSHEILKDLHVSNINRGKVLNRPARKTPDYHYYYDNNENMFLCIKSPNESNVLSWISQCEFGDYSISIPIGDMNDMLVIDETIYEHGRIKAYRQFVYELSYKTNNLDKILVKLQSKNNPERIAKLYSFYFEELYYDTENKLVKGIINKNQTAYAPFSRIEEYEFRLKYENGKVINQCDIIELNNPYLSRPEVIEWLNSLPCDDSLSKSDIELIERVNEGLI